MHIDKTNIQLYLQENKQAKDVANKRLKFHKIDRMFYNCVLKMKRTYYCWICVHLLKTVLVIGLIPINYIQLNGFQDIRVLIVFILSTFSSLLQVIVKLIYQKFVLSNNLLILKIAIKLHHQTYQVIDYHPHQLGNCVSSGEYDQSRTFYGIQSYHPMNRTNESKLIQNIKQITHQQFKWIYTFKKIGNVIGLTSLFYSLSILSKGLGINPLEISIMSIELLIQIIAHISYIVVALFILFFLLSLIVLAILQWLQNSKCLQGCFKFKQKQQKPLFPQIKVLTQKMKKQSDGLCTVCLSEFKVHQEVIVLKCSSKHIFHPQCIQQWMRHRLTCPNCRLRINKN